MNALGRREYIKLIAEELVETYGSTLMETGTDVAMAKAVINKLRPYLQFSEVDIKPKDFKQWEKERAE